MQGETSEQVEQQVRVLKRTASTVSFFLAGVTLGTVLAKVIRSRDDRASKTEIV